MSPYQYLHVTFENFRLGVRSAASKNNLHYLYHVEKKRQTLKDKGDRFMDFVNCAVDAARQLDTEESVNRPIDKWGKNSNVELL